MNFRDDIRKIYLERDPKAIKNDFGKALLLGGSTSYPNGIVISSQFASLSGNGYTALGVPCTIYPIVASRSPLTQIFQPSMSSLDSLVYDDETLESMMKNYSSILFGPGIKESKENLSLLSKLLSRYEGNLVIDATGLVLLSQVDILKYRPRVLLTPHLGEARRLFHSDIHSREALDYVEDAKRFIEKHSCHILLKSSSSVLVSNDKSVYQDENILTPALAKAGSGDGLAGYLAGLLSYADKLISYEEVILFANHMIHKAASLAQDLLSPGIASILDCKDQIINIINENKK